MLNLGSSLSTLAVTDTYNSEAAERQQFMGTLQQWIYFQDAF